jgi:hypothetical protein
MLQTRTWPTDVQTIDYTVGQQHVRSILALMPLK